MNSSALAPECFAILLKATRRSRFDVDFHHPDFQALLARIENLPNTATIENIIRLPLSSGFAAGKDSRANSGDNAVPQIRPTQILSDGELNLSDAYGIRVADLHESDFIETGEVLFNNTNSSAWVGKSLAFTNEERAVCSNHVTRIRLQDGVQPQYVADVLNMLQRLRYFDRLSTNFNNQAGVNSEALLAVRLPLPDTPQRDKLIRFMDKSRQAWRSKRSDAEKLLTGLNEFLLDELGLKAVDKDERRCYAVPVGEGQAQGRLNPDYFHPERILTLRAMKRDAKKFRLFTLGQLAEPVRVQIGSPTTNYLSLAHVQGHTGEFVEAGEEAEGSCLLFQPGDILFPRLRPYLNKVYLAEEAGCCSPEFHILRLVEKDTVSKEFLATILRSQLILAQTCHMVTGNTHPRLKPEDVSNLVVPVPKEAELQKRIGGEVMRRQTLARNLLAEAQENWKVAKHKFQIELLGAG